MKEGILPQEEFRSQFLSSSRFAPLIENTHRFLDAHPSIHHYDFVRSFTGRLYEELGYLWLQGGLGHNVRLLDPDETLSYFLDLYGGLPSQALLQGGILNEYVPDGVILPVDQAGTGDAVVVEYTATAANARLPKYIHHKEEMVGKLRKRFPPLFGCGKLEIIFTEETFRTVAHTHVADQRTTLRSSSHSYTDVSSFAKELVATQFPQLK